MDNSIIKSTRAVEDEYPDTRLFLHADDDDTPKEMYLKMGFEIVDRLYEYSCTDKTVFQNIEGRKNEE